MPQLSQPDLFQPPFAQRPRYYLVLVHRHHPHHNLTVLGEHIDLLRELAIYACQEAGLYARAELCHWDGNTPKVFERFNGYPK